MKKLIFILGLLVVLFPSLADPDSPGTYWVDTAGGGSWIDSATDPGPGNRCTVDQMHSNLSGGDTVYFADGDYTDGRGGAYNGRLLLTASHSGTAEMSTRLISINKNGAKLYDTSTPNASSGIHLYETDYVEINGFEIKDVRWGIIAHTSATTSHHIEIYNCKIHDIGYWNVSPSGAYCQGIAIGSIRNHHWTIERNKIFNIGPSATSNYAAYDHGIYAVGRDHVFRNNEIYNVRTGYFIKCDAHYPNNQTGNTHIIVNNTFGKLANVGGATYGYVRGAILIFSGHYTDIEGGGKAYGVIIQNNAFVDVDSPIGANYMVACRSHSAAQILSFDVSNNVGDTSDVFNCWASCDGETSAGTQADNTTDLSSTTMQAQFSDFSNNDYSLHAASNLLINSGIATYAPDVDIDGNPRDNSDGVEIGCYRFIPSGNSPPNSFIDVPAGDEIIAVGDTINFLGHGVDSDGSIASYKWELSDDGGASWSEEDTSVDWSHQFTVKGTYTVRFTVTDNNAASDPSPAACTITVSDDTVKTVTSYIAANNDDGYVITATELWYSSIADIALVGGLFGNSRSLHTRFVLNVPQGKTVNAATLTMVSYGNDDAGAAFTVYAYDADTAGQIDSWSDWFTQYTGKTTANAAWTIGTSTRYVEESVDVTSIVQEVINRPSWSLGNHIQFLEVDNNSTVDFRPYCYEYGSYRARLVVEYQTGSPASGGNLFDKTNFHSVYRFESGALVTDELNGETLTNSDVSENTTDEKEGSCAAEWDGTDDTLKRTDASLSASHPLKSSGGEQDFSMGGWVRPDADGSNRWIFDKNDIRLIVNLNNFYFYVGDTPVADGGGSYTPGNWYHVVCTFTASNNAMKIRVYDYTGATNWPNGTGTSNDPSSGWGAEGLDFGERNGVGDRDFNGSLDEWFFAYTALSDADIDLVQAGTYGTSAFKVARFEPITQEGYFTQGDEIEFYAVANASLTASSFDTGDNKITLTANDGQDGLCIAQSVSGNKIRMKYTVPASANDNPLELKTHDLTLNGTAYLRDADSNNIATTVEGDLDDVATWVVDTTQDQFSSVVLDHDCDGVASGGDGQTYTMTDGEVCLICTASDDKGVTSYIGPGDSFIVMDDKGVTVTAQFWKGVGTNKFMYKVTFTDGMRTGFLIDENGVQIVAGLKIYDLAGNEFASYTNNVANVDLGTSKIECPYLSSAPGLFSSTSTLLAAVTAGFYGLPDDFLLATTANAIGAVVLTGQNGTSGHPITIDGGFLSQPGHQTYGEYWVISRMIHASTITLGLGNVHKLSVIPSGSTLKIPAGATGCSVLHDTIWLLDIDETTDSGTGKGIWGNIVIDCDLASGKTMYPYYSVFAENEAQIEADGGTVDDTAADTCIFGASNLSQYLLTDHRLKRSFPYRRLCPELASIKTDIRGRPLGDWSAPGAFNPRERKLPITRLVSHYSP